MCKVVKRAFKYRFYPTEEQAGELLRTFGCVRYVYNRALEVRTTAWYRQQRRVSYAQTSAMLIKWKHDPETAWLSEVSSVPLQQTLRHLQSAFVAFWSKQAKYPEVQVPEEVAPVRRIHPVGVSLANWRGQTGEGRRSVSDRVVTAVA
jgi:putative transposase